MPDEKKIIFQLTMRDDQRLEVRVDAPGGQARGEAALPDARLLDEIGAADSSHIPSALVERTGQALYSALVNEQVDELVVDTLNDSLRDSTTPQLELRFDPDQVALTRWPWEMIRNPQGQFLVRDGMVDLTRYITYPQPPPAFDASMHGLPLFRVVSSPAALPPLAADPLGIRPLETLEHATFEGLMRRLLIDRLSLWGIHFDGHGALVLQCPYCDTLNDPKAETCWKCNKPLDEARRIGALAFEKDNTVNWIPAAEFGSVLFNAQVRLAVLLACETAAVGGRMVFSGLAPGLLLAGVPAVIGMQYPVLDSFANRFANTFYEALGKSGDLLGAVRTARRMSVMDAWYSPALYLRRQPAPRERPETIYLTRNIDTAAPSRVQAGVSFLTRLWIRRPETRPLTAARLRDELDIPKDVTVRQGHGEAEIKFEPTLGRRLRRGEVEVTLTAMGADVVPDRMKLFIDELLDAPPAIFTVRSLVEGNLSLVFRVLQDGGVLHTVTHHVTAARQDASSADVAQSSMAVNLEAITPMPIPKPTGPLPLPGDSGVSDISTIRKQLANDTGRFPAPAKSESSETESSPDAPRPALEEAAKEDRFGSDAQGGAAAPAPASATASAGKPESSAEMNRTGSAHPMYGTLMEAMQAYSAGDYFRASTLLRDCVRGGLNTPDVQELLRRVDAMLDQKPAAAAPAAPPPPPPRQQEPVRHAPPQPVERDLDSLYDTRQRQQARQDEKREETPAFDDEDTRPHIPRLSADDWSSYSPAPASPTPASPAQAAGGYYAPADEQAPQAQPPVARPAPSYPMSAPMQDRGGRKSGGFPFWIIIGGLILCLAAVALVMLTGVLGK